jgi:lysophospholipase L1-like esterase
VALVLAELATRLLWNNPYAGTGADWIVRIPVNHPGLDMQVGRRLATDDDSLVPYRQDARGYTRPSFRFADPDFTVVFLGGSTTECIVVREELRFPALVSTGLEAHGLRVNALNAARSGNSLHDSINLLFNHVLRDEPDVAVLMHAVNDAGILRSQGDYHQAMARSVRPRDVAKYMAQWASARCALGGLIRYVATVGRGRRKAFELSASEQERVIPDPAPFRARLGIFVEMCRAFGITPVLMTQPLAWTCRNRLTPGWADDNSQAAFNEVIREVARTKGVEIIDLADMVAREVGNNIEKAREIFYDGMHVTDYGSRLYAERITPKLSELLRSRGNRVTVDHAGHPRSLGAG